MTTRQRFSVAAVLAASMTFVGPTLAGTITIPTLDRGFVLDDGRHEATNSNYITGAREVVNYMSSITEETRSFFIFDLSAIPQEATSAVFRVYNPLIGYVSPDPFETLELNPIEKTPLTLFFADMSGPAGTSAFADLGSHTVAPYASYASHDIQNTDIDAFIDIPLNAEALWDINQTINFSPLGYFGFGGKLTTIGVSIVGDEERVFAKSSHAGLGPDDGDSVLILTGPKIPEPATLSLILSAIAVLGLARIFGMLRRQGNKP